VLISESYRELNSLLHRVDPSYGISGDRYSAQIKVLCDQLKTQDVLDYGCGKRCLEKALGFPIANYDPCIPGLESPPEPHDIVACTDVMEHIEPDCMEAVLKDIRRCTKRVAFFLVSTRPAMKYLSDGRNAHLIQQPFAWWKESFEQAGFEIVDVKEPRGGFAVLCT